MDEKSLASIDRAKEAAVRVLLHNARGPFQGLPRTAGWGYPEPYTRDLMISALGLLVTGNEELTDALRRTLVALATNQTPLGHIPSIAHDPGDRGASDSTPLGTVQEVNQRAGVPQRGGAQRTEVDAVPEP